MKKKPTHVRFEIPEPCSQSVDEMHLLPGGLHCNRCEKTVVDLMNLTDRELIRLYQKRQGRICGIFRPDQLDRNMAVPAAIDKRTNWKAIAAFASALLFGNAGISQTNGEQSLSKEELFMGDVAPIIDTGFQTIKGKVVDENDEPLIGATILLESGKGTVTDIEGIFSVKVPENLTETELLLSYTGFETKTVIWKRGSDPWLNIQMNVGVINLPVATVLGLGSGAMRGGLISCHVTFSDDKETILYNDQDVDNEVIIHEPILEIFPNPFVSSVSVKIELEKPEPIIFHLYNEAGQLVFAETKELLDGIQIIQLNLAKRNLPEGIYFFRISDSIGEIRTKRIVKVTP